MGILKAVPVVLAIAILVGNVMVMDAAARGEARWALQTGDLIVGNDISIQKPQASVFHQTAWTTSDVESTDIAFPILADGVNLGPTVGDARVDDLVDLDGCASSNILPEGPVNLAFPNINQKATQAVDGVETGFFTANWAYVADTAAANLGTEPIGAYLGSGHPFKSNLVLGSGLSWPSMMPLAAAASGSLLLDTSSLSGVPSLDVGIKRMENNTANLTAGSRPVANATNATATPLPQGWGTRKPRVNPKMTKAEIKNASLMQRMYRNAFVGSTMHKAYEGSTQYPTWINPYDSGRGVFNACDKQKIIGLAMNKSKQGARIAPVFWDL